MKKAKKVKEKKLVELKLSPACNKILKDNIWRLKKPMYLEKTDERYKNHVKQLKELGFSNSETWSLDGVISMFILPRLVKFRNIGAAFPYADDNGEHMTMEKWTVILDKMIFAFEWNLTFEERENDKLSDEVREANWKRYQEGLDLFAKWFRALWW